jgi:ATP-dependent protease ClpP protease subunit
MAKTKKTFKFAIDGRIGDEWDGITAKQVNEMLVEAGDVDEIDLTINSPGGDVFAGISIFNALKAHPAKVKATIIGWAASIGSVIVMAADHLAIAEGGFLMVHQATGITVGRSQEHLATAVALEKVDATIAGFYARRAGVDQEVAAEWMADETWFTAEEAVEIGLADEAIGVEGATNMAQIVTLAQPLCFEKTPKQFAALAAPKQQKDPAPGAGNSPLVKEIADMADEKKVESPQPADFHGIKAACVGADDTFICKQLERKATAEDAAKEWTAELANRLETKQEEVDAANAKAEKAEAKAKETPPDKPGVPALGTGKKKDDEDTQGDPGAAFMLKAEQKVASGKGRAAAISAVKKENPELHQAWIDSVNE